MGESKEIACQGYEIKVRLFVFMEESCKSREDFEEFSIEELKGIIHYYNEKLSDGSVNIQLPLPIQNHSPISLIKTWPEAF